MSFFLSLQQKAMGTVLFAEVVRRLELLEQDYFDLEYIDQQDSPVSSSEYGVTPLGGAGLEELLLSNRSDGVVL